MLSPYRVLDLTNERGMLCGQILADLGADVLKVEPPGGSLARRVPPFFGDQPDPERSLFWWAYNRNKRSITLDLESDRGRELFHQLVSRADFLIESEDPGILARRALGYPDLSALNTGLIYVSITPFGQTGPKAHYAASDITLVASSGVLHQTGDEDRAPIRLSLPQSFLHASADAAVGALIALHERLRSRRGQHVDVSAQQSTSIATQSGILAAAIGSPGWQRLAGGIKLGPLEVRSVWKVRDGYVALTVLFGQGLGPFTARLMKYLFEEGACTVEMRDRDWIGYGELLLSGREPVASFEELNRVIAGFLATRSKHELLRASVERNLLIAPIATCDEVSASPQLAARDYWSEVEHPELRRTFRYPGPFARFSASAISYRRRPPLVGEHNHDIYVEDLHVPADELSQLQRERIV